MPAKYRPSSGNNSKLVKLGKRFRGGHTGETGLANHAPSLPPAGRLDDSFTKSFWNGHTWSEWLPLSELSYSDNDRRNGLYRIRDSNLDELVYVGQGRIPDRPIAHRSKMTLPEHRQGVILASAAALECSWVINDAWLPHQRLELENDLIAAFLLYTGEVPAAQFLG